MDNLPIDQPLIQETITWLLASSTPSIRYLALIRLADEPPEGAPAAAARSLMAANGPAAHILAQQADGGYWNHAHNYYSPKYTSSHWSMLLLTEMALPPAHLALQAGARHMLRMFAADLQACQPGQSLLWPCLLGNWLRYQLYCGNMQDECVREVIRHVCADVMDDCACQYNYGLPCAWGVVRALFGLALIPPCSRTPQVSQALHAGVRFLTEDYHLEKGDYPYKTGKHALWSRLSFPLFYQADILFVLRVLKELDAHRLPSVQPARDWLWRRRGAGGTWRGASPFARRTRLIGGEEDAANRWVTLHALDVLTG